MKHIAKILLILILAMPGAVKAGDQLYVDDASRVEWAIYNGRIYFRNFSTIDPTWQGCCYIYYADLATDEGKAMFSAFLTKRTARQPLTFYVDSKLAASSRIIQMGDW